MSSPNYKFGSQPIHVPNDNSWPGIRERLSEQIPRFSFPFPFRFASGQTTETGSYTEHIVQHSPSLIASISPDGATISLNDAGCRITGYTRREIIGKNWWTTIYAGEKYKQIDQLIIDFERDGWIHDYELEIETKFGETRIICWTSVNRFDEDGTLLEVIGIGDDVTERKRAQAELIASEARLEEAQQIANLGSWEFDLLTDKMWLSKAVTAILELDSERTLESYEDLLALVHPDDREKLDREYAMHQQFRRPYDMTVRFPLPNNRTKYIRTRCETLYDEAGNPVRSIGTSQDVTKEIVQEERLRRTFEETNELKAYTDHIVQNSPSFIVGIDSQGKIVSINDAGCEISGYERDEIIGRNFWRMLYPGERYAEARKLFRYLEQSENVKNYEMTLETKSGEPRTISWTRVNRYDDDGNLLEHIGVGEDITERKKAELELIASEARLEEAQRIAHVGSWNLDLVADCYSFSHEAVQILEVDMVRKLNCYADFINLVHPDDQEKTNRAWTEHRDLKRPYEVAYRLMFPDERIKYLHVRCDTIFGEDGEPKHAIGTVQDVTEEAERKHELSRNLEETEALKEYTAHIV